MRNKVDIHNGRSKFENVTIVCLRQHTQAINTLPDISQHPIPHLVQFIEKDVSNFDHPFLLTAMATTLSRQLLEKYCIHMIILCI